MDAQAPSPRYLRFLRSLLVTGAVASVPLVSSCTDDEDDPCDQQACVADGDIPDAGPVTVDGPLPPPDLPLVG